MKWNELTREQSADLDYKIMQPCIFDDLDGLGGRPEASLEFDPEV